MHQLQAALVSADGKVSEEEVVVFQSRTRFENCEPGKQIEVDLKVVVPPALQVVESK